MWRENFILVLSIVRLFLPLCSTDASCVIECDCNTPVCWNQLSCCPESLIHRDSRDLMNDMPVMPHRDYRSTFSLPVMSTLDYGSTSITSFKAKHRLKRKALPTKTKYSERHSWQNQSCVYTFVHSQSLYERFRYLEYAHEIRVIHDCRENHIGSDLQRKCWDFRKLNDLDSEIFVFDPNTTIVYANRFCAECCDVKNYTTFQHRFICSGSLLGDWALLTLERTPENEMALIRSGLCVYFLTAPGPNGGSISSANKCFSVRYTECMITVDDSIANGLSSNVCLSTQTFNDANWKYCALCDDNRYIDNAAEFVSENRSVITKCGTMKCFYEDLMSNSFLILLNLDAALLPARDDRITEPTNLDCGNQSTDLVYDKFMVGIIFLFISSEPSGSPSEWYWHRPSSVRPSAVNHFKLPFSETAWSIQATFHVQNS